MIKKLFALSISLTLITIPVVVHAKGNSSDGQTKVASCVSCHGENGNSMVPSFPKLAGQHEAYLVRQLQDLKDGFRNAPMMAPLAMALDDKSIEDIAAYYSSQKISSNPMPYLADDDDDEVEKTDEQKTDEINELLALGLDLYKNGNLETKVSACIACHGPNADGNEPAAFPSLKGQHADYLIKTLTDFKNGDRSKISDNMMHMIAKKMSKKEIQAVAFHISMMK